MLKFFRDATMLVLPVVTPAIIAELTKGKITETDRKDKKNGEVVNEKTTSKCRR